jgi:hypothetical protein
MSNDSRSHEERFLDTKGPRLSGNFLNRRNDWGGRKTIVADASSGKPANP